MYEGNDGPNWGQGKFTNYDHGIPCQNKSCKSYGRPHPNCRCTGSMLGMTPEWYAPKGSAAYERAHEARNVGATVIQQRQAVRNAAGPKQMGVSGASAPSAPADAFSVKGSMHNYAHGGEVGYCSMTRKHDPGCEYYAQGGEVQGADDPMATLGHAAIHHGLMGIMSNVGKSTLQDPQKHTHIIEDAKTQHQERSAPAGEQFKKTLGNQIGNHIADQDHEKMAAKLQGQPLVGQVGKTNLTSIMGRLNQPMIDQPANPAAFRGSVDYLNSSIQGGNRLDEMMGSLIGSKGSEIKVDKKGRMSLKEQMQSLREDPSKLLEMGGDLGHYLPEHHAALGATVATATDYLNSLEPVRQQRSPLDDPSPDNPVATAKFDRALDIAHQPLIALQRVKDGTLLPVDVQALETMYPKLKDAMAQKMVEKIITAKAKDERIPYKQKITMSMFLGQPLDSTMTAPAMQAIMQSAATQQAQKQMKPQPGKPSAVEMKQVNKTDAMYALPTERKELNRKS